MAAPGHLYDRRRGARPPARILTNPFLSLP